MAKARDAFRTISEVSEWLDTPAHVLRFWESKFSQIKPVKRAGGRRYYRPDDMRLLAGIKILLHEQGMTIKGAQKLLREKGIKQVQGMSPPLDGEEVVQETPQVSNDLSPDAEVIDAIEEAEIIDEALTEPMPLAPAMPPPTRPSAEITAIRRIDETPAPAESAPAASLHSAETEAPADEPHSAEVAEVGAVTPDPVTARDFTAAETVQPAPAPSLTMPRVLGLIRDADAARVQTKAGEIAPLLAQLEELRDRMRAG